MNEPTTSAPAVSVGPFDERPNDQLRRAIAVDADPAFASDWRAERQAWLVEQLHSAGIEAWEYDLAVVDLLAAHYDPTIVHVIGAWVARAAASRG